MDFEVREKIGIFTVFLILAIVFALFNYPILSNSEEVFGEVTGTYQKPIEGGSKSYLKIMLEDGNEINTEINKAYKNADGKKVKLQKITPKGIGTTKYIFKEFEK